MTAKTCATCQEEKDLKDFRRDRTRPDGRQSYCKLCARKMHQSLYSRRYKHAILKRDAERRKNTIQKLNEFKLCHPCITCGESDPVCLEFHHLSTKGKDFTIAHAKQRSWSKVLAEIQKCVVLCSNCHKKVHAGTISLNGDAQPRLVATR